MSSLTVAGTLICGRCGTAYPADHHPEEGCRICAIGHAGSHQPEVWSAGLESCRRGEIVFAEAEPGLVGLSVEPRIGLGQRAFYLDGFFFDCVPAFTHEAATEIEARGGLSGIVILHPLAYGAALSWAREFSAPILVHQGSSRFVPFRERVEEWQGERLRISDDTEVICLTDTSSGGVLAHWKAGADGRGTLIASENLHVLAGQQGVSFMSNVALAIPRSAHEVEALAWQLARIEFESLYGSLWGRVISEDARSRLIACARRYLNLVGSDRAALRLVA